MKPVIWVPIYGAAEVDGATIRHTVQAPAAAGAANGEMPPAAAHTILRSNIMFQQGEICWQARLGASSSRVQLLLPAEGGAPSIGEPAEAELVAGLNVLDAPYGFALWTGKWEPAGGAGHGTALPADTWLDLKLTVRGSLCSLYVNEVKVVTSHRVLRLGQVGAMLEGDAELRNIAITASRPSCFVVMQFTPGFNALYREVISPVCEEYGYSVARADDFYTASQILDDITQSIRGSALVIADVTPENANVYYELGYAHAINKPTILLSDKKRERLPFDISGYRTIFYDNTIGGKSAMEERLRKHLQGLRAR